MSILVGVILAVVLVVLYCLGYYWNHKTPVPKGCENLKAECEGCRITSCENNPVHDYSKGDKTND